MHKEKIYEMVANLYLKKMKNHSNQELILTGGMK